MKKLLLYIILFSYAIVMFKPAFPYVEDFIGHVLYYKQHMATVHYENGKYHVHAEIAKNTKEDNPNKSTSSSKKQITSIDHIVLITSATETNVVTINTHKYPLPGNHHLLAGNPSYNYPPPRI
jgi:hypothetical protein